MAFFRKTLPAALCAVLAAAVLASCSPAPSAAEESPAAQQQVTLDVWHQWADQNSASRQAVESAAASYEQEHPNVKIVLHSLDGASYKSMLSAAFSSDGSSSDIDVFYDWAPGKLRPLVTAGKVLPLDGYVSDAVLSQLRAGSTSSFTFDGKLYGLPIDSSMMLIYCNTALFAKAGAALPDTYDDLLAEGQTLKNAGVTPLEVGAGDSWLAATLYEYLALREVGAGSINSVLAGETAFTEQVGFRTAAEEMNELYCAGLLGSNPLEVNDSQAVADFLAGKSAMLLDGTWAASNIDADTSGFAENVAVIPFPGSGSGAYDQDIISGTSASFFVNRSTDTPAEAADFAVYLCRSIGTQTYRLGMGFSCWTSDTEEVSPTLRLALDLFEKSGSRVPSWDTVLDAGATSVHLTECQALLSDSPDFDAFVATHGGALQAMTK